MPRSRGKPPPEVSAELRSGAIAIVADRAERGKRPMAAAALAAELGVAPRTARAILDELRAAELAPPSVIAGVSGRRMAAPPAPGKVVRLPQALIEQLATATGRPAGENLAAQISAVLARLKDRKSVV